jgi:hypothetical protein
MDKAVKIHYGFCMICLNWVLKVEWHGRSHLKIEWQRCSPSRNLNEGTKPFVQGSDDEWGNIIWKETPLIFLDNYQESEERLAEVWSQNKDQ